jgi:hypothetical protein
MIEQVRTNPNAKIAQTMNKKTGDGYPINNAIITGNVGTIPAGTILPVAMVTYISSQTSRTGEIYNAVTPYNYITKDKFILIQKNANLKGQLADARPGKWFIRNGVLVLSNSLITTVNDQSAELNALGEVIKYRSRFMKVVRFVFKGETLDVPPGSVVYVRLRKPIKIDLTNVWIIKQ